MSKVRLLVLLLSLMGIMSLSIVALGTGTSEPLPAACLEEGQ
jgi:hypothetical protein